MSFKNVAVWWGLSSEKENVAQFIISMGFLGHLGRKISCIYFNGLARGNQGLINLKLNLREEFSKNTENGSTCR